METKNPIVTIRVRGEEPMLVELYPDKAPNTVRNFLFLVQQGYYSGSVFHRVIPGFMIQGGAGSTRAKEIKGEFKANGFPNDLLHVRGVISMARTPDPNSASSQFFLMHRDSPHLDGQYAAFGRMLSGFETLDVIAKAPRDSRDRPLTDVVIESIEADTQGIDVGKPIFRH